MNPGPNDMFDAAEMAIPALRRLRKKTKGTKELAEHNVNITEGCSGDCVYCYAREYALRHKRIKTRDEWKIMKLRPKMVKKGWRKREGRILYNSSTNTTRKFLWETTIVLRKLLRAGNEVIFLTKPDVFCIKSLIGKLLNYKRNLTFMFTIGSFDNHTLKKYEPGCSTFESRFESLKAAHQAGFKTSVIIEPFLDEYTVELVQLLDPYVTKDIWIGPMNLEFCPKEFVKDIWKPKELYELKIRIDELAYQLKIPSWKIKYKDSFLNAIKEIDLLYGNY